ncbi:unnamed protein product [Owenia fusiformis]|uniref:Uncharacterized protein n=1 Tax=Owenia fusiformis TaxID=6347 RepID=A0A8J1TZR6_OWEFU|nr:unnamed protein product [Owenia fusiformis]
MAEQTSHLWLEPVAHSIVKHIFKVGRKLGISDEDMDILKDDHQGNSEEMTYRILRKWHKSYEGRNPKVALHDALVECGLNDIADKHLGQKTIGLRSNITENVCNFMPTEDCRKCREHLESSNILVLTGLSGSGKTEIAKHYWAKHKKEYEVGWTVHSRTEHDLYNGLKLFHRFRPVDSHLSVMLGEMNEEMKRDTTKKFLIIFDDVTEETQSTIQQHFNPADNIKVIITTELRLYNFNQSDILEVGGFTKKEMSKFLDDLDGSFTQKVQLWTEMGHLPCAIACAVYDIRQQKTTIDKYLKEVNDVDTNTFVEQRTQRALGPDYKSRGFVKAHIMSVRNMIQELREENGPLTKEDVNGLCLVLKAIAYMDSKAIPVFLLEILLLIILNPRKESRISSCINQLLDKMLNRCWIGVFCEEKDKPRLLDIHELVQLAERSMTDDDDDSRLKTLEYLLKALLCYFTKDTGYMKFHKKNLLLLPHVEKAIDRVNDLRLESELDDPVAEQVSLTLLEIDLLDRLGHAYSKTGQLEQAEERLIRAVDLFAAILETTKDEILQTREELPLDSYAEMVYHKLKDHNIGNPVIGTVLNDTDIEQMKLEVGEREFPNLGSHNQVTKGAYKKLVDLNLALPEGQLKQIYVTELMSSTLYAYGRLYYYHREKFHQKKNRQQARCLIAALRLAHALGNVIAKDTGVHVLHTILTKRSGLLYLHSEDLDENGEKKSAEAALSHLYEGKKEYKTLLQYEVSDVQWFQRGILKVTKNDPHHGSICREKFLFICKRILDIETDASKRSEVERDGKSCLRALKRNIENQEHGELTLQRGGDYLLICAEFNVAVKQWQYAIMDYKESVHRYKEALTIPWKKYARAITGMMKVGRDWFTDDPDEPSAIGVVNYTRQEAAVFVERAPQPFKNAINVLIGNAPTPLPLQRSKSLPAPPMSLESEPLTPPML